MTAAVWLLALLAWLPGCKKKETERPMTPPDVAVVAVAQRDVRIYRDWVGTLEGEVNATISAQVSGYLISRDYSEGSDVTNGQVLFRIDPAPFEATLAQAKAQLVEAQANKGKTALDVERYTPLAASQAISKQELDDAIQADKAADGQVASAKAAVEAAQLNLNFTTIRAPVTGSAGLAKAQIGNLVGPATGPLTTVVQMDPIRVYFSLSQEFLTKVLERRLAEGKEARAGESPELELVMANGNNYSRKGWVTNANNLVDQRTGTIMVVGQFPNPDQLLVPGMFVRVRALLATETNALLVPQRAVTDMQGSSLIAVVGAENKVSIRPVEAVERVGQDWLIKGPVKAGDRVIAEGIQKVRDGAVVNPVPFVAQPVAKPAGPAAKAEETKEKK
jgi:membrane fusion protein (multidrug efflux system)